MINYQLHRQLRYGLQVRHGSWSYMAQKEARGGNEYSALTAIFLSVASAVTLLFLAFTKVKTFEVFSIFIFIMGIVFFIQLFIAIIAHREEKNNT